MREARDAEKTQQMAVEERKQTSELLRQRCPPLVIDNDIHHRLNPLQNTHELNPRRHVLRSKLRPRGKNKPQIRSELARLGWTDHFNPIPEQLRLILADRATRCFLGRVSFLDRGRDRATMHPHVIRTQIAHTSRSRMKMRRPSFDALRGMDLR